MEIYQILVVFLLFLRLVTGNLTVEGTTTTLDSNLTEVDRIEVGANSTNPGIAVTQSGTGAAAYFNGGDVNIATGNH